MFPRRRKRTCTKHLRHQSFFPMPSNTMTTARSPPSTRSSFFHVVGAIVKNATGAIFKIEQIDIDGAIFLRPSKQDGEFERKLRKTTIEMFLRKYSITTSVHEMLELKGALFVEHPDTIELVSKSQIFLNMVALPKKNIPHICVKKSPDRVASLLNRTRSAPSCSCWPTPRRCRCTMDRRSPMAHTP